MRFAPASPWCPQLELPIRGEKLQAHIGIATGTVVIGEMLGSGDARHQAAVGETPNVAARLQEIAEPDCLVIDDATRRQIGGLFTCRDLGELALKGFRLPVRAWRVIEERTVADRFAALRAGHLVPLVDREAELALLLRRWRQAAAGNGQLVMLAGEPGIGKSRLVVELRARLRGRAARQPAVFLLATSSGQSALSRHRPAGVRGALCPQRHAGQTGFAS